MQTVQTTLERLAELAAHVAKVEASYGDDVTRKLVEFDRQAVIEEFIAQKEGKL